MIKKEVDRCRKKRYNNRVSEVRNVIHLKIGRSHMKKRIGKNKWLKGLFFCSFFCLILIMDHSAADAAKTLGFYEYYTETNDGVKTAVISKYNGVASELTIPSKLGGGKVTKISSGAFAGNDNLVKVTLPGSVTSIGERAFSGCTKLNTINLGKVEHIGAYAFFYTALKSAQMTSVQTIDKEAFKNCASLVTVNFGTHEVLSIADEAFRGTAVKKVVLNCRRFVNLRSGIFRDCEQLESVAITTRGGDIPDDMFNHCTALTSVALDDNITHIGNQAFQGCTSLRTIRLPQKLTQLSSNNRYGIFSDCTALESIDIPASVRMLNLDTFYNCPSLKKVTLHEGLLTICTSKGSRETDLAQWKIEIPKTVQSVDFGAYTVSHIVLPNSVETQLISAFNSNVVSFSYYKDSPCAEYYCDEKIAVALDPVPATKLTLDNTSVTMQVGDVFQVKSSMLPANTTDAVTWSSTNTEIAEVNGCGVIKANKTGTIVIRAKSTNGCIADVKVNVKPGPSELTLDCWSEDLGVGETITCKATVDKAAYNKKITFESSNPAIASVDKNGKVKALKNGDATITAITSNGLRKSFSVHVMNAPKKVSVQADSKTVRVKNSLYLRPVLPQYSASHKLTYTSSNKKIATVSGKGVVVGKKTGTVTITVKTFNGKTAKIKIKVVK